MLPSVVILGFLLVIALGLTSHREWAAPDLGAFHRTMQIAAIAVLLQAAHFGEELLTGFREEFPELFGFEPMSSGFFVSFNLAWLVLWGVSAWGVGRRYRAALFPLWFLALGGVVNGIAHPGLAVVAGGYFPGLVTSPAVGILGLVLLRRLVIMTQPTESRLH